MTLLAVPRPALAEAGSKGIAALLQPFVDRQGVFHKAAAER